MKRSRHSRYDKKRPRDKKDVKRKFTFSTKKSENKEQTPERTRVSNKDERKRRTPENRVQKPKDRNSNSENTLASSQTPTQEQAYQTPDRNVDFEVFSQEDKKYQQRTSHRKKKSGFPKIVLPVGVVVILLLFRFLLNFGGTKSESIPNRYEPVYQERVTPKPTRKRREKINAALYIIGKGKRLREITQLTKDSTVAIIPNVNVRLFKGFHIYDTKAFPNTPILASYSKYHFFYDEQKKNPNQSISEQWSITREKLAESVYDGYFLYQYPKEYTIDDMLINEIEFSISSKGNVVYGVATLVEYKNKRYFFQFISKERDDKSANYNYLRKYLNYYLKIKKSTSNVNSK